MNLYVLESHYDVHETNRNVWRKDVYCHSFGATAVAATRSEKWKWVLDCSKSEWERERASRNNGANEPKTKFEPERFAMMKSAEYRSKREVKIYDFIFAVISLGTCPSLAHREHHSAFPRVEITLNHFHFDSCFRTLCTRIVSVAVAPHSILTCSLDAAL